VSQLISVNIVTVALETRHESILRTRELRITMAKKAIHSFSGDEASENGADEDKDIAEMRSNAEYIAQLVDQLNKLAMTNGLNALTRLLDSVHLEAELQSNKAGK
jgi:hypothetical protein